MSPELETLDQLLCGDFPLSLIRSLFAEEQRFVRGVLAMLATGEVRLLDSDCAEVPRWQWQEVLKAASTSHYLSITDLGAHRIA
jgi:hypothetical protein